MLPIVRILAGRWAVTSVTGSSERSGVAAVTMWYIVAPMAYVGAHAQRAIGPGAGCDRRREGRLGAAAHQ